MNNGIRNIRIYQLIYALIFWLVVAGFIFSDTLHAGAFFETETANEIHIKIKDDPAARKINEGFLGTNILYWIDNDDAWAKGRVPDHLKELGMKTLRYPGGEVADNYDWETNSIERKDRFPFEAKSEKERHARLDYREFLEQAKKLGIKNIFFVVNLEGAFFQPGNINDNIERYAEKAAKWVKAVREAGYKVTYWEIGNESYLRSAYPLTAHEYASALKVFYRKMKDADPSVKIGAIGPHSPYGDDGVGYADALGPLATERLRTALLKGEEELCKDLKNKKACAKSLGAKPASHPPKWWDVILQEAKDSFDFVVIHRYRTTRLKNKQINFDEPLTLKDNINELKKYIETRKGAKVELALTEWNTPKQVSDIMTESEHLLDIAEQMGNYLEGGVDFALYWPFRIRGKQFSIVSFDTKDVYQPYYLFRLFNRYHEDALCKADYDRKSGVYVLCTQGSKSFGLLVINRTKETKKIILESAGKTIIFSGGEAILKDGKTSVVVKSSVSGNEPDNSIAIEMIPQSVIGIKINSR